MRRNDISQFDLYGYQFLNTLYLSIFFLFLSQEINEIVFRGLTMYSHESLLRIEGVQLGHNQEELLSKEEVLKKLQNMGNEL